MSTDPRRRREGGRGRRTLSAHLAQLPWRTVVNPFAPLEVLSADQVEAIHRTSLRILEELGIEVMSARGRAVLAAAGAQVEDSGTVRLDRALVDSALKTAPSGFTLTSRNPDKTLSFGGAHVNFSLVAGPPNVHDRERGRRPGNLRD